ncbi:hypothetical protein AVEN_142212-1, partial [Araneus ventricosus]
MEFGRREEDSMTGTQQRGFGDPRLEKRRMRLNSESDSDSNLDSRSLLFKLTASLHCKGVASEDGDSALLVCHKFPSSLTRQICHDKAISSQNQTFCKLTCYL